MRSSASVAVSPAGVAAARAAFPGWSGLPGSERAKYDVEVEGVEAPPDESAAQLRGRHDIGKGPVEGGLDRTATARGRCHCAAVEEDEGPEYELREREVGASGGDEAVFLVRPNVGLPFAPVAETASGGELSAAAVAAKLEVDRMMAMCGLPSLVAVDRELYKARFRAWNNAVVNDTDGLAVLASDDGQPRSRARARARA